MTADTQIIPAIDLREGRCVRLEQGRFDTSRVFHDDPLAVARQYAEQGAKRLHLVDLDAAQGDGRDNNAIIEAIAGELDITIQVGGGIRRRAQVDQLLHAGASRAVIGSLAIKQRELVHQWLGELGSERVVLALDVNAGANPLVQIHGWQTSTNISLWQALDDYVPLGLTHLLCTDIERDGMQSGPSIELYRRIMARYPKLRLQASGGVRDRRDIHALAAAGVPYAISGRALLEGTLTLDGDNAC